MFCGPVGIEAVFALPKPKSRIRKTRNAFPLPQWKPDLDNLVKAMLDALTGILWVDDNQIVYSRAAKVWAKPGQERTLFHVWELSPEFMKNELDEFEVSRYA